MGADDALLATLVVIVELAVLVAAADVSFRKSPAKFKSLDRNAAARLVCEQDPLLHGFSDSQHPKNGGWVFAQV